MKINVKDDVFDIVKRLKQIDNDYFVVYDTKLKIFQLHCLNQPQNTFCLTLFDCLDERSIIKTLKTRKQNQDLLWEEIDKNNAKLEQRRTYASK